MSTYAPLLSATIESTSSVFTISNIPQTYSDLIVTFSPRLSGSNGQDIRYYYNGETTALYSYTFGTGYNAGSNVVNFGGTTGRNYIQVVNSVGLATSSNASYIIDIPRYAKENINKTALIKAGIFQETSSYGESLIMTALWRSTSAINSITFYPTAGSFAAGSTFNVYGIGTGSPKAMGGDSVYSDGTYWIHEFKSSGYFIPSQALTNVDYLVLAGGGGGGFVQNDASGGGGAGGFRSTVSPTGGGASAEAKITLAATSYVVTVGAGGAGGVSATSANSQGGNSSISGSGITTVTSTGGGGGGGAAGSPTPVGFNAGNGGSGGGAGGGVSVNGTGTSGQGYDGGSADYSSGGGAGGAGSGTAFNGSSNSGAGVANSITGSSINYAGGGNSGGSQGGSYGGGNGEYPLNSGGNTAGATNKGAGGGGRWGSGNGSNGGSGIVIVRYPI